MNTIMIVLPILTLLMFEIGLSLRLEDFRLFLNRPRPILVGLVGQLVCLPLMAYLLGTLFGLEPVFFVGIMLIACSPGGSSSNVFSMLAGGDLALSVALTAFSSILTLFTIPVIMGLTMHGQSIQLPVGNLIMQNLVMMLVPILAGVGVKHYFPKTAVKIDHILSRIAFPALIFLATVFFIQHRVTIVEQFGRLGLVVSLLILTCMAIGSILSHLMHLTGREKRTLVIEIGMQNAAQAIALAASPFVFNNDVMAVPAIIYALMMNVILLIYVAVVKPKNKVL